MNKLFLHTLTPATGPLIPSNSYLVNGVVWQGSAYSSEDSLSYYFHGDDNVYQGHLNVKGTQRDGVPAFYWEYFRRMTEKLSVRGRGAAATVEEACAAALFFIPEMVSLEYLGRVFLCYSGDFDGPRKCKSWDMEIDGELCAITGPHAYDGKPEYFAWERSWEAGRAALFFAGNKGLSGEAPTLQSAIIAAVDAPELFKRACASLVATLHKIDRAEG